MGTFQAPNRTNITQPINTLISPPQAGETGVYNANFDTFVRLTFRKKGNVISSKRKFF
jgi:hypothetical protein